MNEHVKIAMMKGFKAELEKLGLGTLATFGLTTFAPMLLGALGKMRKGPALKIPRTPGA